MADLAKKYGDIFSVQLGSRFTVVLSSKEAIYEAYVKNAKQFAGRPDFASFSCTNHGSVGISLCTYDDTYAYNRKNTMRAVNRLYMQQSDYHHILHEEASKMVAYLDDNIAKNQAIDPIAAFKKIVPCAFLSMMFGKQFEYEDPEFQAITNWYHNWFENAEADNPPDFFPTLKLFPNARLNTISKCGEAFEIFTSKKLKEFESAKENIGLVYPLYEYFGLPSTLPIQKQRNFARVVADLCGGGFDTVASTLAWAPMYLLEVPKVLEKARNEILSVFGDSPIDFEKRESTPFFCATVYDILRHSSVGPLGLPRVTMQDVKLRGYNIPKNTMVFVNLWGCNHDTNEWKETEFLHPENFLNESGALDHEAVKKLSTFSTGVRRCPGEKLAVQKIYIFLGTILQKFEFEMEKSPLKKIPKRGVTLKPHDYTIKLKRL